MKPRRFIGPMLFWSFVVLLSAAVLLLFVGLRISYQRADDLSRTALDGMIRNMQVRLDGLYQSYTVDLKEEASFNAMHDSISRGALLERWGALMNARWSITAVQIADEHGDGFGLQRKDSTWIVRSTGWAQDTMDTLLSRAGLPRMASTMQREWMRDTLNDPRGTIWFSRALEDRTGEPIWSSEEGTEEGSNEQHVSLLLRARIDTAPYRIVAFSVNTTTAFSRLVSGITDPGSAPILLNGDGDDMLPLSDMPALRPVLSSAMEHWRKDRRRGVFHGSVDGQGYHAQVIPYTLNGETLQLGAVVTDEQLLFWTRPERNALAILGGFLAVFVTLLLWSYARRKQESALLRQQQQRDRSRERELAKALGERDVLDREVHHRVKNNLQVVSSLLNLQAQRIPEGPIKAEFMRGKRRIDAIALVHHKLYGMHDLRTIRLRDLFEDLAKAVAALHEPKSLTVSHSVDTSDIVSDPDTAIELGIILCELLDNCHQHAFPYATGGHIDIQVRRISGDLFQLTVKDNGKGMDNEARMDPTKLGLEIVDALAGQLDGSFTVLDGNGVTFDVQFRMLHPLG